MLKGRNLLSPDDFSSQEFLEIIRLAQDIKKSPGDYLHVCDGKLLGALFFEPSTRTRLSFESAMLRLGGRVVGFADATTSSTSKGESLVDTIRTVGSYTDIIAMRHPKEGAASLAAEKSFVPIINAGDGGHQHPTQTLTDLVTIMEAKGTLSGMTIGFCGDLKFGRTVHSLIRTMTMFPNNRYVLISPEELRLPRYWKSVVLDESGSESLEVEKLEDVLPELDILYMTRVQKERFFSEEEYIRLKDSYVLDPKKMELAKKDMIVLHPLPRVNEISVELDSDSRAWYFHQVKNGMYARMSLISKLLGVVE